jgi:hypothetical protein
MPKTLLQEVLIAPTAGAIESILASMGKNEFRITSAAFPTGADRRFYGRSGGRCRRRGC